ncbi:hypothetical protein Hden_3216 [Hyphomicrobium denitrificans ATCC 51888]|uniref:Uncharacterized protein n=1 Tax=Hyphomicrobium denitrificans (strain ATCC 51888 / DSM 1869 / NCIMB 11706 / TK 0415) TaxID=582899 RepID=D8JWQ2_HYPDA|nr:hypothetical protein Hden_3216 [Hyphomicrobium denitrificans ATCC 51888]
MAKQFRYMPVLRWKLNDRTGLLNVSATGGRGVAPLIQLWPKQYSGPRATKPKKGHTPLTAAEFFAKQVSDAWGVEPVYLDASQLVDGSAHPLIDIAKAASVGGLNIIPVVELTSPVNYQVAAKKMAAASGSGIGLRISLPEMTAASAWVPKWPYPASDTDLIVDLGGSVANVAALGVSVANAFASLHSGSSWRTVTLIGCSIPTTLSGFSLGRTMLPRHEFILWRTLTTHGLPYRLDFGDYGSIAPGPPIEIEALVPINAKYSLPEKFAVFRGVKIKGPGAMPMSQQLRSYAKQIVALKPRHALKHCWADGQIDAMHADPSFSVGNPGVWVGLNLNRHIEITRHTLP